MSKLSSYFVVKMQGPPNGCHLQDLVLFNIIYYGGRRGCENLRNITKLTFEINTDSTGRRYLYQVAKELDKNHKEDDYSNNNEARIYELTGTVQYT